MRIVGPTFVWLQCCVYRIATDWRNILVYLTFAYRGVIVLCSIILSLSDLAL